MIRLIVGDDRRAEPSDTGRAQLLGDPIAVRAAVDEDRRRCGRLQEDRVSLADIEDLHPEPAGRCPDGVAATRP